ncbi:MAG: hypothetical protein AB1817_15080 [Chloroflexota bacterium]
MKSKRSIYKLLANLTALIVLAFLLGAASAQSAASSNRAGLVIVHGNGQTVKRCVEFAESQITGLDLLTRTGLDLNVDASNAVGVAVCRIDQEGCTFPGQPCFCQCQGSPCIYWSYWHLTSGTWKYSGTGASISAIHNGDVDGWVWGVGTVSGATPPPAVTFDQVCAPSTATATRTATATNPPPTNTAVPSTNTPVRSTATSLRPTNTPLPASRTPTALNLKPTNTPISFFNPSSTLTKRAVSPPTGTWTPPLTAIARVVQTKASPIQSPPLEEEKEEDLPAQSASDNNTMFGSGLRLVGIALTGCGFCGVALVAFGVTLVALKRLA